MYLKTTLTALNILDAGYRIRKHRQYQQQTFTFEEPFHIMDWFTDKVITPVISHSEKLWSFIKNLSSKDIVIESVKRVPAFAITDTIIFTLILYLLGYTITTTLVIAVFIKALLIAMFIAPISYIIRRYYENLI